MENIVLDPKKDSEKERDYVKLLYSYPLDELYSDEKILEKIETIKSADGKESTIKSKGAMTPQGNIALELVKESTQNFARENIEQLISANDKVRAAIVN